ncbi:MULTISPECIES: O-antigen ligase family protein [unclassified Bradyrhizobium]|nr:MULTISPECIES: O-antigen ligase family protein [unclassified Bradyrhizobium]
MAFTVWRGPGKPLADHLRLRNVDYLAACLLIVLPWSSTATSIFGAAMVIGLLVTADPVGLLNSVRRPAGAMPIVLILLVAAGTLWATDVPWLERLSAVEKMSKLALLPFLLVHFQGSPRARMLMAAFISSNVVLLAYSFIVATFPTLSMVVRLNQSGVPVRNYIDQTQGFTFCAVILAGGAIEAWMSNRSKDAVAIGALSGLFLLNLIFVSLARTAFIYGPLMIAILMARYCTGRAALLGMLVLPVAMVGLWQISPNIQTKVRTTFAELNVRSDAPVGEQQPSAAVRLEFWRKSVGFVESAPILGHGTGSIRRLFENAAVGKTGIEALAVSNPHSQTLAAAIQWGILGVLIVWMMWIAHLGLFLSNTSFAAWVGMLATAQNIASSVFNSHLVDSYELWLYVLAVGIAGGAMMSRRHAVRPSEGAAEGASNTAGLTRRTWGRAGHLGGDNRGNVHTISPAKDSLDPTQGSGCGCDADRND